MLQPRMMTTGEIAKYCGVNFRTVIRWIERGHLKSFKLPGRGDNRVTVEDFLDFLRENHMPVPDEFRNTSNRILIVEDETPMANAIQRVLRGAGYETQVASNGFSAGALVGTFNPALVTLDLRIPGMGGIDVLKFIRSIDAIKDIRILVVSAMPQIDLDEALAAGANDILSKPFQNEELLEKIQTLMT